MRWPHYSDHLDHVSLVSSGHHWHWSLMTTMHYSNMCFITGRDTRLKRSARQIRRRYSNNQPVYAYLRKVPIQRQYLVSYPYGVGGNTLLDTLLGTPNFDNWLFTSILSYFSARYFYEIKLIIKQNMYFVPDLF